VLLAQVVHFYSDRHLDTERLPGRVNTLLPTGVWHESRKGRSGAVSDRNQGGGGTARR